MTVTKKGAQLRKLIIAGICLAMAFLLPFLTGQIPVIGAALSPMHIPVLLCGFLCGWHYGLAVGFAAPLLRTLIFTMPPLQTALAMAFELAAYGIATGLLYRLLPKKPGYVYVTLVASMLFGRVVWGVAAYLIALAFSDVFTVQMFLGGAFINAVPGIICHILLIPPIVIAMRHAKLID